MVSKPPPSTVLFHLASDAATTLPLSRVSKAGIRKLLLFAVPLSKGSFIVVPFAGFVSSCLAA